MIRIGAKIVEIEGLQMSSSSVTTSTRQDESLQATMDQINIVQGAEVKRMQNWPPQTIIIPI